jgi:hypothetical protein
MIEREQVSVVWVDEDGQVALVFVFVFVDVI